MRTTARATTTVQPGGRVEICDEQLPVGAEVDVLVLVTPASEPERPSIRDVLAKAPGHLIFETAEQVDAYLREEREAWER
jgi:hypothetical protein